jgi:hypothetical protein
MLHTSSLRRSFLSRSVQVAGLLFGFVFVWSMPAALPTNATSPGTVVAWGWNNRGQTDVPADLSGVAAIAAGQYHTVALKSDGTVVAWGDNGFGQTTVPAGLSGVTAIAAGGHHTVALVAPTPTPTPTPGSLLTALGPASVWVGLKNSDDVGIRFDLRAEAYRGATLVGSGDLASAVGGSSGFNNAKLDVIPMTPLPGVTFLPGEELKIKLLVRNACTGSGKNSGHARLWFNDSAANSRFDATIGSPATYYLRSGPILATTAGSGPKTTIDVAAGAKCSAYKSFGMWSITLP